jgi:ferritin
MKISDNFEKAINKQIHLEWSASYSFLAMCAWLETTPFKGFAKWMLARSQREMKHTMQLFEYLRNRFGKLNLTEIPNPPRNYGSPLEVFKKALELKQTISKATSDLFAAAVREKDLETQQLLHSFLKEQVDEEKRIQDAIDKLQLAGDSPDALLHLDYKEEKSHA